MLKLAFCGYACSGKTTAAQVLIKDWQAQKFLGAPRFYYCKFAAPLYQINTLLELPKNRAFMQKQGDLLKLYFGRDFFVERLLNYVDEATEEHSKLSPGTMGFVLDDCRFEYEAKVLKERGWRLIWIQANEDVRRKRSDALGLEWVPTHASEDGGAKKYCTEVIVNEGTVEELADKVRRLM